MGAVRLGVVSDKDVRGAGALLLPLAWCALLDAAVWSGGGGVRRGGVLVLVLVLARAWVDAGLLGTRGVGCC